MNQQLLKRHWRHNVCRAVLILLIIIVALVCWHWTTTFPARHLLNTDIVTQTKAMMGSSAGHVQQAINRSGKTNIRIQPSDDLGDDGIFYIYVEEDGMLFQIGRPDEIHGTNGKLGFEVTVMPDSPKAKRQFQNPPVYAVTVTISNGTSTIKRCRAEDDSKYEHCFTLNENDAKLEKASNQAVWDAVNTAADNW
ncbi:hypothetical protein PT279_02720 [Bifidobacterium sp. ESL0784]|uniref:hypothetical protein n=1 Tax=Bifidobacterium sp. ESL0784 TaxID=2983231 RepID=UPI0023F9FF4D|nr:hypothetical protein [Bifidobacterium sp. ESL0784]MDF7640505.1 hypothetical protein [Bifidobacterium sp. ESL0784]